MQTRTIEVQQHRESDTLSMTNVPSQPLSLRELLPAGAKISISASIVSKEGSKPIILLAYHASSDNDLGQRDSERRFIHDLIPLLAQQTGINDIVVAGDFNDNAYAGNSDAYVIDGDLARRLAELSPNVVGLGLAQAVVLKIRGSLRNNGSFQGPNLYLNQQPKKDGLLVADSKDMVVHIQVDPQKPLVDLTAFNLAEIPTLEFVSQDTGGTDHADATLEVNGIVVVASSFMSTRGFKGFTRVEEKYQELLTEENRDKQIQSTLVLYGLVATQFGVPFDRAQSADSAYIIKFVKKLHAQIDPEKFADAGDRLTTCLTDWKASSEYRIAQQLLTEEIQRASDFEPSALAAQCLAKPGKALDTIAQALQGQPCAGYMPEVNGHKEGVDNALIDMLHMRKMMGLAEKHGNKDFFTITTEGGIKSKDPAFAHELSAGLQPILTFAGLNPNRLFGDRSEEKKARTEKEKDTAFAPR